MLGRSLFAPEHSIYFVDFADAGGITDGAKVLMAGVKVGSVTGVRLVGPTHARVTLALDKGIRVPIGSRVVLPGSLIGFGDKAVTIEAGASSGGFLAPGGVMVGTQSSPLESSFPEAKQTIKELNATLVAARELMEDQKLKKGIEDLLTTSQKTLETFSGLAAKTQGLIVDNRATLSRALNDAAAAMAEIRKGTEMVAKLAGDKRWSEKAMALLDQLNATGAKAQDLIVSLDSFVNDPKLRQPLNDTAANVAKITDTGTRIASNAEDITKNGVVLSSKAIELADKASSIADEAKEVVKKLQKFFDKVPTTSPIKDLHVDMDVYRQTKPNRFRTDFSVSLPIKDNMIHAGIYDAFETNKLTLQLGKQLNDKLEYRYGIYASKPGVGVDYDFAPGLGIRGDLFDINDPRFDLRAKYKLGKGVEAWFGFDQIFKQNVPMFGIGIRR